MRIRHHVNPLKVGFTLGREERLAAAPDLGGGEVEVEIGCADAQFLFQRAAGRPTARCLGLEIRDDLVADVNQRARERGLDNLRALFAHANLDLERLFPDHRLARVYVNFPDPWWKRRHHKRRLITSALAATIARKLAPGGLLLFQSDIFDLALDAMAVFEETPLVNRLGPWSFARADEPYRLLAARSLREDRCQAEGRPIWRLLYDRPALPLSPC